MNIISRTFAFLARKVDLYLYRLSIPSKVKAMRQKQKIRILFVVSDVSIWKTEELYCKMLENPKIEPIIGVSLITADKPSEALRKFNYLIDYLSEKGYAFTEIYGNDIKNEIRPDIIFYQQPYDGVVDGSLFFRNNLDALFCYVNYGFNSIGLKWVGKSPYLHYCWQTYYENLTALKYYESAKPAFAKGKAFITGLPFQDILQKEKSMFSSPWQPKNKAKKKIIWAPHHTIPSGHNLIDYSTFLKFADTMLEIAEEFKDSIQMSFKPHPFLLKKLYNLWGREKADSYYLRWSRLENTQFNEGEYYGLFKHSDALIHDCSSFTIEYLYMDNPVMYLSNGKPHTDTLNDFGKAAYKAHVKGSSKDDIVKFIQDVIEGNDLLKDERDLFLEKYLAIPDIGNASQNIINAIINL